MCNSLVNKLIFARNMIPNGKQHWNEFHIRLPHNIIREFISIEKQPMKLRVLSVASISILISEQKGLKCRKKENLCLN